MKGEKGEETGEGWGVGGDVGVGRKMGMEIADEWSVSHRKVARPVQEKSTLSS